MKPFAFYSLPGLVLGTEAHAESSLEILLCLFVFLFGSKIGGLAPSGIQEGKTIYHVQLYRSFTDQDTLPRG